MAEWSCSGLQSRVRRFDSDSRLQLSSQWHNPGGPCPGGETGRRRGLKIPWPKGRAGSIPALGTTTDMRTALVAVLAMAAALAASPASAQTVSGAFTRGQKHFVLTASTGYAFDESYLVLGLGATYYLVDGLGVGLHIESWSGSDPSMTKLTASTQYVFHQMRTVKPYLGAFYRRTDINGLPDLDSVGGRAGVYLQAGPHAYIGLGGVYESYLDCDKSTYRSCDSTYAEVTVTIAF